MEKDKKTRRQQEKERVIEQACIDSERKKEEERKRERADIGRDRYAGNCTLSSSIVNGVNVVIGFPRKS